MPTKVIEYLQFQSVSSHDLWFFGARAVFWTALAAFLFWLAENRWRYVSRFRSEKRTPLDLAIFRIALMVDYLEVVHDLPKIRHFAALDSALIVPPAGWGPLAACVPRNAALVEIAGGLFIVCTFLGLVGLWTRISIVGAVISAFYLMTSLQIFGKVNHSHHLVLFGILLCFSPCADALSVDAYLRKRRGGGVPSLAASRRYGAPLQNVMLLMGLMYFFPGIWKISRAGTHWFTAEHLRSLIERQLLGSTATLFQVWTLHHPVALVLAAFFTIVFEVGWLFAVMSRRMRPLVIVSGLTFHTVTGMVMNISFWTLQCCYVALVDWGTVGSYFSTRIRNARIAVQLWVEAREHNWAELSLGRPFNVVATVLFVGMVLAGITHRVSAWPIGCYPTFDELPPVVPSQVRLVAHAADGKLYLETLSYDPVLQAPYGSERYQGIMAAVGCPGRLYNDARARAVVRLWEAAYHHPDIVSAEIYCDSYSTSAKSEQFVEHRLMGVVSMNSGAAR